MIAFSEIYGHNYYSQNYEDGIIQECILRMGIKKGICAEFGAADGKFCSNTFRLLEQDWKGIMIEADKSLYDKLVKNVQNLDCQTFHQMVLPENINEVIPLNVNVLSIDTDSRNDYDCWKEFKGNPEIVIIEINSSKDPLKEYLNEGASYSTMFTLGVAKGYFLLCHVGNLIFIRNEFKHLFPELDDSHPLLDVDLYFKKSWLQS